jgi:SAM-dependent methyltransferase
VSAAVPPTGASPQASLYDSVYAGVPNWDIGRPQRAFVHLEEAGAIGPRVLDVGCGTGELALFLARRGHRVLGVDFAPRAVATAREKARWRRVDAQFLVWDALDLPALASRGLTFDTVTDSAMLHTLAGSDRDRFVDGVASVLRPGGRLLVLCDARADGDHTTGGLSRREFRERFHPEDGWEIEFVAGTVFERRYSSNAAYIASIRRTE